MEPEEFFDRFLLDAAGPGKRTVAGPVAEWRTAWRARARELSRTDPVLAVNALQQGFVLKSSQLSRAGVTRAVARRHVRQGRWLGQAAGSVTVVHPGADSLDTPRRRHALACAAVATTNPGFVVGGLSAAILHGLPTIDVPAEPLLVAPPARRSHRRGRASILHDEVDDWFGIPVLTAARTVVDIARRDRREGIVVADAALREGLVDRRALTAALERAAGWCGIKAARELVAMADGRGESPLESLTRLALADDGFPAPEPQVVIGGYRVDLCWRNHRLVLECDGRLKYREDRRWREKRREIALERLGWTVERVLWEDVMHGWARTAEHLRSRLAQS